MEAWPTYDEFLGSMSTFLVSLKPYLVRTVASWHFNSPQYPILECCHGGPYWEIKQNLLELFPGRPVGEIDFSKLASFIVLGLEHQQYLTESTKCLARIEKRWTTKWGSSNEDEFVWKQAQYNPSNFSCIEDNYPIY